MKTAVILLDMLSTFYINKYNGSHKYTLIDKFIDEMGGTLFINANSGSADTPRSISELLSGVPSYLNGCNTRVKYPRFNLNKKNIFDKFLSMAHSVKIYTNRHHHNLGVFPKSTDNFIRFFEDDDEFISAISKHEHSEKEFVFIYISDYHDQIDHRGANIHSVKIGQQKIYKKLSYLNEIMKISDYDNCFVISDHGHLITRDYKNTRFQFKKSKYNFSEFIGPKRNRVFMLWHKKGDNGLFVNTDFTSLMSISKVLNHIADSDLSSINESIIEDKNCLVVQDYLELKASTAKEPNVLGIISFENNIVQYKSTLNNQITDNEISRIQNTLNLERVTSEESREILYINNRNTLALLFDKIFRFINNLIFY